METVKVVEAVGMEQTMVGQLTTYTLRTNTTGTSRCYARAHASLSLSHSSRTISAENYPCVFR